MRVYKEWKSREAEVNKKAVDGRRQDSLYCRQAVRPLISMNLSSCGAQPI
jgi:hypothetical protein